MVRQPQMGVRMHAPDYAIGQAVYIRTDLPDYLEVTIPFHTLSQLVRICSEPKPDMLLDKVVFYALVNEEARSVTMSFLSASKGARPGNLDQLLADE
jgi:hypothetical protein